MPDSLRSRSPAWLLLLVLAGLHCRADLPVDSPPRVEEAGLDPDVASLLAERVKGVENEPGNGAIRGQLALAYEANGATDAARTVYAQAEVLDGSEPQWPYHLARMLADSGDNEAAVAAVERAIALEPGYAPAHRRRGEWLLELGRIDDAELAFRSAVELDAGDEGSQTGLGRVYLQKEQELTALEILQPLLGRTRNEAYIRQLLGTAYRQLGRIDEARAELALAAGGDTPVWADPWRDELERYVVGYAAEFKRGMRLLGARRYEEGIPLLEELRAARPDDVTLLSNLGAAYVDVGRLDAAVATLQSALEHDPDHFGSHLNLSAAMEARGQIEPALTHIDAALESNPYLAQSHLQKGRLLLKARRAEDALESFEAAGRYDAVDPTGPLWCGWIHAEMERWPQAVEQFSNAVSRDPGSGPAHLGLAMASAETGDVETADREVEIAARLSPRERRLDQARRRIERARRAQENK